MTTNIYFQRITKFLGRNGLFKSKGIVLHKDERNVQILPITTKDKTGRCLITIPIENVPELIDKLKLCLKLEYGYIINKTNYNEHSKIC